MSEEIARSSLGERTKLLFYLLFLIIVRLSHLGHDNLKVLMKYWLEIL